MPRVTWQTLTVLSVLLAEPERRQYGLELSKAADLASGTIYPILARLEKAGWVSSEFEDIDPRVAGRRPRRYYLLTGEGARLAEREITSTIGRLRLEAKQPETEAAIDVRVRGGSRSSLR
jgi:DNA-binding PadR family transcriptional regulator